MGYVIQIEWLGGYKGELLWTHTLSTEEPTEHAGRFVSRYDPDAHGGLGQVWTTADPRMAIQFISHGEAVAFYRQASTVEPVRDDGKPNRPLTAFTVSIFDWEKA